MLAFLWSIIRETFSKFECKICKENRFKSIFVVRMLWHFKKVHQTKPTKRTVKFLLRYNLITRLLFSLVAIVLFVPLFVLKFVLLPLKYLYEIL